MGVALLAAACGGGPVLLPPSEQPLDKQTLTLLSKKGMTPEAPIFVRIFKEESELEVWKTRDDGRFYLFKTYPVCAWSGEIGPKLNQGDKQAPEGFYTVQNRQMNPNSQFHVSFNLGFPNVYDRAHKRTGESLMVHGGCSSAGCYAMTDALMEEIYAIAREAFKGGQQSFDVHAFPFRMTDANMARVKGHKWYPFWVTLKQGYDHFEKHRLTPGVGVCESRYVVNVNDPQSLRADARCPRFSRPVIAPFTPKPEEPAIEGETPPAPEGEQQTAAGAAPVGDAKGAAKAPASGAKGQPSNAASAARAALGYGR